MNKFKKIDSHDDNRHRMCLMCLKKKTRSMETNCVKIFSKGRVEVMINTHFDFNANDERLPNAVCGVCLRNLYRLKSSALKSFKFPNLTDFYKNMVHTRSLSTSLCTCKICIIAREPLFEKVTENRSISEKND